VFVVRDVRTEAVQISVSGRQRCLARHANTDSTSTVRRSARVRGASPFSSTH